MRFIQCFVMNLLSVENVTSTQCINSYFYYYGNAGTSSVTNCVVRSIYSSVKGFCSNSIIGSYPGSYMMCSNCVSNTCEFSGQPITAGNKYMPEVEDFFKEGSDRYELKDEYATQLLGSDGTQVGIHGGSMPFDPTTTSLKITKFNVGARTTADGKLPVEIEVNAN